MSFIMRLLKRTKFSTALPIEGADLLRPKPFGEIPGPVVLPFIGASWKYLPYVGNWDLNRLHLTGVKKLEEYGPIVREEVSGIRICHVFKPEDIEQVYKSEGKYPARRSHLALDHYRKSRPHLYNNGGILPTNGSDWWHIRSNFQKHIARIHDVRNFLPTASSVISEFRAKHLDDTAINDFIPVISKLYLELIWMFMFGERLRSFEGANLLNNSFHSRLVDAAETINSLTVATDSTEKIWKNFETPTYKKFESLLKFIERIVFKKVDEIYAKVANSNGKEEPESFLIEKYIRNLNVDRKDLNGMAFDLVLAGVDTTSYATSFAMYNLSCNKEAQEKLREEALKLLPTEKSEVTSEILNSALYARAVLKESFRLNPISIGISRFLPQDTVFSGFLIPKGTLMLTQNMVACRMKENFSSPESFIPERWIKGSKYYNPSVSPFLVLPFSHGPRSCLARRFAEQNLLTLLLLIGRNCSVSWQGSSALRIVTPTLCKPEGPVKLAFKSWETK